MVGAILELRISDIVRSPNARQIRDGKVLELIASIREIGLRQPINVRPLAEGRYEVRGGGHRMEACRQLGWSHISALVVHDDDLHAELAEIDENLVRNELSPAERAISTARRKAIYEDIHPETAHGGDRSGMGGASRQVGDLKSGDGPPKRFTQATADVTGASERSIQRDAARGEKLGPEVLRRIVGTAIDTGEQIDALAKLSEPQREAVIARVEQGEDVNVRAAFKAERRETRERDLAEKTRELPERRYAVIYADPPWRFDVYNRDTGLDRSADNHYPTMTTPDILAMPVSDIAASDCVLFLWATVPMLPEALAVMAAWGFAYKSHQIWNKDQLGTGYWFRNKHELLLVGVRGNIPAPLPGTQAHSVVDAPVRDHSRKPVIFRMMIEGLFPNLPKIELFCRTPAPGWDVWGKEAPQQPVEPEHALDGQPTTPRSSADDLMLAHHDDDNDGVRNAPEGGYAIGLSGAAT